MISPTTVDYSPLTQRVNAATARQIRGEARDGAFGAATAKETRESRGNGILLATATGGFFVVLFGMIALVQWALGYDWSVCAGLAMGSAVLTIVFYLIGTAVGRGTWRRTVRLIRFARANGFDVEPSATNRPWPGILFQHPSFVTTILTGDVVSWSQDGYATEVGLHRWAYTLGTSSHSADVRYLAMRLGSPTPRMSFDCGRELIVRSDLSFGTDVLADDPNLPQRHRPRLVTAAGDEGAARMMFNDDLIALLMNDDYPAHAEVVDGWFFAYYRSRKRLDVPLWRLHLETAQLVAQNADALRARAAEV